MYYGNTTSPVDVDYNKSSTVFMVNIQNSSTIAIFQLSDQESLGNHTINIPIKTSSNGTTSNYSVGVSGGTLVLGPEQGSIKYTLSGVLKQLGLSNREIETLVEAIAPVFAEVGPALLKMDYGFNSTSAESEGSLPLEKRKLSWKGIKLPVKLPVKLPTITIGGTIGKVGEKLKDNLKTPSLQEIIDKVKAGISDIGQLDATCTIFATGALPGYLAASTAANVRALGPGHTMTHDQMFFLYPVYKDYPLIEDLRVHYNFRATTPEAQQFAAITFLRNMYIVAGEARKGVKWNPQHVSRKFRETTKTLIHEIRHTQQYRSHGWSKEAFGYEYLYQWCKNGYHYGQIRYELEAAETEQHMNYFLDQDVGYAFFEYWKARNLQPVIGYPTEKMPQTIPGSGGEWDEVEVQFQQGVLQHTSLGGCSRCFRVLEQHHVLWRQLAALCAASTNPATWCPGVQDLWYQKQKEPFDCISKLERILYNGFCY
jgi:hypothetical protein